MFKKRYRVVTDQNSGYQVQVKHWWWPVWGPAAWRSWTPTIEQAKELVDKLKAKDSWKSTTVLSFD